MTTKLCTGSCGIEKEFSEFYKNCNKCKRCHYQHQLQYENTNPNAYFGGLLKGAKAHGKIRHSRGRHVAGECNLTLQDLQEMYRIQKGQCYYTGLPLSLKRMSDWQCSIERIDVEKGYTLDNTKLIVLEFQHSSQWCREKMDVCRRLVSSDHEPQKIIWNHEKKKTKTKTILIQSIIDNIQHYKCKTCEEVKPCYMFTTKPIQGCKQCISNYNKEYNKTPNGHMRHMLCHMKHGGGRRSISNLSCTLQLQDLINIFESQGGLCHYSGIPMNFGSNKDTWWTCSPERLDMSKGYTKSNVCLICFEFNTADRTANAGTPERVLGSCAWSKDKIDKVFRS